MGMFAAEEGNEGQDQCILKDSLLACMGYWGLHTYKFFLSSAAGWDVSTTNRLFYWGIFIGDKISISFIHTREIGSALKNKASRGFQS